MKKWLLVMTVFALAISMANQAEASRWRGKPCDTSYSYNEPADQLAAEARSDGTVTWLSDTTFRLTDSWGCSVVITGTPRSGGSGSGGGTPAASSSIAVNKVIRQNIFQQAKPKAQPKKPAQPAQPEATTTQAKPPAFYENVGHFGRLNAGAADVFYNKWEVGESDGSTFGINPSATWGESDELTLTAPLHIISGGDDTIFALGVDGAYKRPLTGKWEKFSVGIHAYGMGFFGGDDTATTFGGGPFFSYNYRINPKWIVSAGGLLEFTKPDEGDTITELVPGVNVGYNLSDNVALNGYVVYYKNLDSDAGDDGYADVGADVQWVKGSWSLSGGIKTATGLDDVSSTEIYLGSNWMF